ncbi:hypothetical protein AAZX31_20G048300 [Glycine max]|uniref:Uncharacterized protein n=2 Tax=Glycine subgen. Soja TaxID=1462606 RepID=K7N1N1_SOYBN|nr:hypothetical protein JHK87_055500 [Glycine soja]KAG4917965.1 hypothetical protein JHK85_056246 [Glycine max]KAG5074057.1 hypothetical protein JHK84_055288 [Glycine max]KAG5076726.1 hypothetical protein JHK82_055421 [Glycine max]KAH1034688.1 hypothetical protein GYH30_054897 [Glycine max]
MAKACFIFSSSLVLSFLVSAFNLVKPISLAWNFFYDVCPFEKIELNASKVYLSFSSIYHLHICLIPHISL